MFHYVGPYIFDRLITSLSCHASVYVMRLSKKKNLRSWLKGSLSWSKSECETARPCILCTSCLPRNSLTFKPRISYALTWSECLRLPSKDHDPESVGTLLDGRIELLKSNTTSEFFHVFFFCPAALWHLVFFDSTQKALSASRHYLQTQWKRHWSISQTLTGILYLFWSFLLETNKTTKG